eukprot:PLAT13813.1.p1 GENE.PLAT13813.1~~PLAT13813.1.p1  ORF type:complete len:237 (-),score=23.30 PLAT13813.1:141-851(-)
MKVAVVLALLAVVPMALAVTGCGSPQSGYYCASPTVVGFFGEEEHCLNACENSASTSCCQLSGFECFSGTTEPVPGSGVAAACVPTTGDLVVDPTVVDEIVANCRSLCPPNDGDCLISCFKLSSPYPEYAREHPGDVSSHSGSSTDGTSKFGEAPRSKTRQRNSGLYLMNGSPRERNQGVYALDDSSGRSSDEAAEERAAAANSVDLALGITAAVLFVGVVVLAMRLRRVSAASAE